MANNRYDDMQFEDVSSYSSSKEYKKKKKNKRGRTVLKSIMGLFSVLFIVAGMGLIYLSTDLLPDYNVQAITKDKEELMISPDATTDDSITNIALFGLDARDGSFQGLSDTIIVVSVDNKHNKIKMTSFLRDSKVVMAGYGGMNKINSAYSSLAYPDDGGPELAIKTLNYNFNLNITEYATINFANMANVVDAFGGVDITMTDEEAYQTNENINALMYELLHMGYECNVWEDDFLPIDEDGYVAGGSFHLNGNQAVAYARNRSDSDNERSKRQRKVLMGLLTNMENMSASSYYSVAKNILPMCETSLEFGDLWNLAPILTKDFTIETITIPSQPYENPVGGDMGDGLGWVWEYDLERAAQHVDSFIYEDSSPYWDPSVGTGADNLDELPPDLY